MGCKSKGVEGKVAKRWRVPDGTLVSACPDCGEDTYHLRTGRGNSVRLDIETCVGHWHLCPARKAKKALLLDEVPTAPVECPYDGGK